MGKGEIARYKQFLLFQQCFQKACFPGRQKVSFCGNGLNNVMAIGRNNHGIDVFASMFSKAFFIAIVQTQVCLLTLFQTSPVFYVSAVQVYWKHWEKEKLLVVSNFCFSHSVLYLFGELSAIFIKFYVVVCRLIQFGRDWNLSFGKGLYC